MSPLQFWLSVLLLSHLNFNSCFSLALSTRLVPSSRVSCMESLLYPSISTPALFLVLYQMFSCSIDDESFRIFWVTCSRLLFATLSVCLLHNVLAGLLLCGWVVRKPILSAMLSFVLCFLTFLSVIFFPFAVVLSL